jgi:hypothetical protein
MTDAPAEDTVLFSMHMEKCGGTSLDRLLRAEYGEGFFLYDPGPPDDHRTPRFPADVRCIHGHMFYGLHAHLPERPFAYITLLRDPVERFLSQFDHLRRYEHPLHEMAMAQDGLERMCAEYEARHYRNLFVRRLAGVWEEVQPSDLDRAEERLRSFAVVGALERSDAFLAACRQSFGWGEHAFGHHNAAPGERARFAHLSSRQQELVREANRWDVELMQRVGDLLVG